MENIIEIYIHTWVPEIKPFDDVNIYLTKFLNVLGDIYV